MDYQKYIKYKNKYIIFKNIIGGQKKILNIENHKEIQFINQNKVNLNKNSKNKINAIVLPHAGQKYVSFIFDYIFNNMEYSFNYIIILTTNHKNGNNYQPISDIIDKFSINILHLQNNSLIYSDEHFLDEHSYLSLLPYLKKIDKPIYLLSIGNYNDELVNDINSLLNNDVLLICNTDLLHCGSRFNNICPKNVDEKNLKIIKKILENNKLEYDELCGINVMRIFNRLVSLQKYFYTEYIYSSSNNIDTVIQNSIVGYTGIIYKYKENEDLRKELNNYFLLNLPKLLLNSNLMINFFGKSIDKNKINFIITQFRKEYLNFSKIFIKNIIGCFITIMKNNKLRGCIGSFSIINDIIDTILSMTLNASFNDTRFLPIIQDEIKSLSFKINFIKEKFKINGVNINDIIDNIIIGIYGIEIIFQDNRSALYLASVLQENYDINNKDYNDNNIIKYKKMIKDLQNKAESVSNKISEILLFECIEL